MNLNQNFSELRRKLVETLKREGIIKTKEVMEAMLNVPREEFVPEELKNEAYIDCPLPIGYGKTISAPHMVAIMNEALELKPGLKVLEVGAGSGYHAATIAEIVAPKKENVLKGHVYTIEIVPELAEFAEKNLRKLSYTEHVTVIVGDGSLGYLKEAPYDRILVTAAASKIPEPLIEQLKNGGILVIPVGSLYGYQSLLRVKKDLNGKIFIEDLGGCAFVPLLGKYGFHSE
jgi:protein-L-isoaspartate(D-aspartate) O-methyltransferase